MFKKLSSLKLFAMASLAMAVAMTVANILVYQKSYDPITGLWFADTQGFVRGLFYLFCLFAVGFAAAFALSARHNGVKEDTVSCEPVATKPLRYAALASAVVLVATVVAQFLLIGSSDRLYFYYVSNSRYFSPAVAVMHTLTLIAALPAAFWFFSLFMKKKVTVAYGIAPIVYFLLLAVRVYFDTTYHLNNPRWASRIVALVVALLFLLFEVRQLMTAKKLALYHTAAVSATVILTVYGLHSLFLNLLGTVSDGAEILYDLLLLTLAAYAFLRVWQTSSVTEVPEVPEATEETTEAIEAAEAEEAPIQSAEETDTDEEAVEADEETVAEPAEETPEEEPAADLPDLSEAEVKRFLSEMTAYLAEKQGVAAEDKEAYGKVQEQALLLLGRIMETEDRSARITAIRSFLEKRGA